MHQDRVLSLFAKIYKKIGSRWPRFIEELKTRTSTDEPNLILLKEFVKALRNYGANLSED